MCNCKHTESGVYKNQVELEFPPLMLEYYKESGKTSVSVDACIADEIKALWEHDIRTTGCCCGHNWKFPYIGVVPDDIAKMKALGYKPQYNPCRGVDYTDEDTFFPKVYYPYHIDYYSQTTCPRCGKERGQEQAEMYGVNGCDECRTDQDRRCESYRSMRQSVAGKSFEEQRDAISKFRAGLWD